MSNYHADVLQADKLLGNLERWLDKAIAHAAQKKYDPAVLLLARLAPDMYPLRQQIQNACDGAKFLAARLSGKAAPKHADTDQSLDELRARIRSVREYLATFTPADFVGAETRVVPLGFLPGKAMLGADWVREMSLPNTYFHFCMAYAILRHNGVDVGKTDFIGSITLRDL